MGILLWDFCHSSAIPNIVLSVFPLVSYRNMRLPTVPCCGRERALFTYKPLVPIHKMLYTSAQSFVHVSNQVIKLDAHA